MKTARQYATGFIKTQKVRKFDLLPGKADTRCIRFVRQEDGRESVIGISDDLTVHYVLGSMLLSHRVPTFVRMVEEFIKSNPATE